MTDEKFWSLKIVALLHDPPGKILGLSDHQRRAFEAIEAVLGGARFHALFGTNAAGLTRRMFEATSIGGIVKKADQVASAIDRTAFPNVVQISSEDYRRQALVKHPLSGQKRRLTSIAALDDDKVADLGERQLRAASELAAEETDLYRAYLRLWRDLPGTASEPEIRLLPPDTRIVDHALWAHLDATAAVAGALPRPALLVFGVGPVQGFIAEARRTQDLWMGSFILAYLTWAGIRTVIEAAGPDAVLYPALRGQPLVDHWLAEQGLLDAGRKPTETQLATATFPNKFVALFPTDKASEMACTVEKAIRQAWREIAGAVRNKFPGGPHGGQWEAIWRRQVEAPDWPEVYWSALSWPDLQSSMDEERNLASKPDKKMRNEKTGLLHVAEAEKALTLTERFLGPDQAVRQMWTVYKEAWPQGVNCGTFYGQLFQLAERGFAARKGLRNFDQAEEEGEKCTVSGTRSALRLNAIEPRQAVSQYWQSVAAALRDPGENRYHEVKPDGSERLSAIVAVKRFAQRAYFQSTLGLRGGFPSTSRLAAAPFIAQLLQNLNMPAIRRAVANHVGALRQLGQDPQGRRGFPRLSDEAVRLGLPYLWAQARGDSLAIDFLHYDADALYEETFDPRRLDKEYGLTVSADEARRAAETCRALVSAARGADLDPASPSTYYAVLLLDGDGMGGWLAGKRSPQLRSTLHPAAVTQFETLPDASEWDLVLKARRPLSAALHDSISSALASFALCCVPQVVERRYPGRMVYAGGDDLLALLPVDSVLAAARELRALFSGQATVTTGPDGIWRIVPAFDPHADGFLDVDGELLLTMGPRASVSAGIAIAHHQSPLDGVLAAVHEAEEAAKEVYDRNAVCVYALKRSGEALRVGGRWYYRGCDLIAQVEEIRSLLAQGLLSSKFGYEAHSQARAFPRRIYDPLSGCWQPAGPPWRAWSAVIRRLVKRHWQGDREQQTAVADHLAESLTLLTMGLSGHRYHWERWWWKHHVREPDLLEQDRAPQPGPVELGKWLLLARFLETGGEE